MDVVSSEKADFLIGVNYFSGWWRDLPNKYVVKGVDWRTKYPERIALLGCYNDQPTMDHDIIAASDFGVQFFLMLWYPPEITVEPYVERLNLGIEQFLRSPENHRMRFAVEFCNHPPFMISDPDTWERHCEEWVKTMTHSSYLRIGGKAFFKIHSLRYWFNQCQGRLDLVQQRLSRLREIARSRGMALLIGGGVTALDLYDPTLSALIPTVDFLASYMDVPQGTADDGLAPYHALLSLAEKGWAHHLNMAMAPYMPYLPAGWAPRPWEDPRPSFSFPDRSEWVDALTRVKSALTRYPGLRVPDGTTVGQKMFNIYAWNEFAEGGIVAPSVGDGWMKLEGIREVFSQ